MCISQGETDRKERKKERIGENSGLLCLCIHYWRRFERYALLEDIIGFYAEEEQL